MKKPPLTANRTPLTEQEGEKLIEFLRFSSREISLRPRECVQLTHDFIYFVLDGKITVAFPDEDIIIDYAFRLMPLGLSELLFPELSLYYRAVTPSKLLKVPLNTLESIYTEENIHLMRTLFTLKSTMLNALITNYRERCTGSSYKTIKSVIEHYNNEPRKIEGIASYIMRRTNLSKSYVFRTLSILKEQGVLSINNGKITTLHTPLPEKI